MSEVISIINLCKDSVTIMKQKTYTENEVVYKVGDAWCVSYINEVENRKLLESEISEPYLSAILAIWGTEPTIALPVTK